VAGSRHAHDDEKPHPIFTTGISVICQLAKSVQAELCAWKTTHVKKTAVVGFADSSVRTSTRISLQGQYYFQSPCSNDILAHKMHAFFSRYLEQPSLSIRGASSKENGYGYRVSLSTPNVTLRRRLSSKMLLCTEKYAALFLAFFPFSSFLPCLFPLSRLVLSEQLSVIPCRLALATSWVIEWKFCGEDSGWGESREGQNSNGILWGRYEASNSWDSGGAAVGHSR
jgi:hypothetical protein